MRMRLSILLLHYFLGQTLGDIFDALNKSTSEMGNPILALECREVLGKLVQIDAGAGQVFGVNEAGNIYTLYGRNWAQLPGILKHVSVGPAGVWGTCKDENVFKLVGGQWVKVPGLLKNLDAGGEEIIVGTNVADSIFCMGRDATVGFNGSGSSTPWQQYPGHLKYYSCGPNSCWGVNCNDDIYMMMGVTRENCLGTESWQHVSGKLTMIEVSTDGCVHGVSKDGKIYRRDGITSSNPAGTDWVDMKFCMKAKHVSCDLGHLWVITRDNSILDCV